MTLSRCTSRATWKSSGSGFFKADRKTASGRDPDVIRLAGDRRYRPDFESGIAGARTNARNQTREDGVLTAEEARELLDSINIETVVGLRDRALIALMTYTFARVSAATEMKVSNLAVLSHAGAFRCISAISLGF